MTPDNELICEMMQEMEHEIMSDVEHDLMVNFKRQKNEKCADEVKRNC